MTPILPAENPDSRDRDMTPILPAENPDSREPEEDERPEENQEPQSIFDTTDADMNGIFDIFESVIEENLPFEEDCSCLTESGIDVKVGLDGSPVIIYTDADGVEHEYPGNYGLTECMAWDMGLPPTCDGEDAEAFCADSWCYVSNETCKTGVIESTYFPDAGLFYSYDTCTADEAEMMDDEDEEDEPEDEEEDEGEDDDEE